jgi:hypothetical protein
VTARWPLALFTLFFCWRLVADDAIVIGASADHLSEGSGGSGSLLWLRSGAHGTVSAGATLFSLPGTRWAYATLGGTRRITARTMLTADASLGHGTDDAGGFRYLLVRGGVVQELLSKRLYGEAEWLQADVARQKNGIARIGATWLPAPPLTLRGSLYQSVTGDDDTTLVTVRGDYDLGRITAIAGFSAGRATPALLQERGSDTTRVAEGFAGVVIDAWTIIVTAGDDRQRVSFSWRLPLPEGRR